MNRGSWYFDCVDRIVGMGGEGYREWGWGMGNGERGDGVD